MALGLNYKPKRLLGIATNDALLKIWKEAYHNNNCTSSSKLKLKPNSDDTAADADADADTDAIINIVAPTNEVEAIEILRRVGDPTQQQQTKKSNNSTTSIVMPIRVVQALRLLCAREEETTQVESLVEQLALSPTKTTTVSKMEAFQHALEEPRTPVLVFTPPPEEPELTPSRKKYLLRREKLKLLAEETKYNKITINLQDQRQEDDVTAKSMTYAASVGLNMIVAPISFGTFMFFFSGGVFDYFFPKVADEYNTNRNTAHNPVDIKRVIIGVVSGVIMMIIEMVLFVIRTHEFDHYATKKKKARGVEPFGAYTSKSIKEYYEDENHNKINNTTPVATTNTNTSISTNNVVDKEKKNS